MPTLAEQMVTKLEELLLANPGATSVNVDGTAVSFADLEKRYDHWKRKQLKESDGRPVLIEAEFQGGT